MIHDLVEFFNNYLLNTNDTKLKLGPGDQMNNGKTS